MSALKIDSSATTTMLLRRNTAREKIISSEAAKVFGLGITASANATYGVEAFVGEENDVCAGFPARAAKWFL